MEVTELSLLMAGSCPCRTAEFVLGEILVTQLRPPIFMLRSTFIVRNPPGPQEQRSL